LTSPRNPAPPAEPPPGSPGRFFPRNRPSTPIKGPAPPPHHPTLRQQARTASIAPPSPPQLTTTAPPQRAIHGPSELKVSTGAGSPRPPPLFPLSQSAAEAGRTAREPPCRPAGRPLPCSGSGRKKGVFCPKLPGPFSFSPLSPSSLSLSLLLANQTLYHELLTKITLPLYNYTLGYLVKPSLGLNIIIRPLFIKPKLLIGP
jgi:hypothetical protein